MCGSLDLAESGRVVYVRNGHGIEFAGGFYMIRLIPIQLYAYS